MATAPVKSQPLHNFDLPHLRWAHKNHHSPYSNSSNSTHNRFRRRDSPDLQNHGGSGGNDNSNTISNGNGNNVTSLSPSNAAETDLVPDDASAQVSKICFRTPRKPFSLSSSASQQNHQRKDAADTDGGLEKDKKKEKEKEKDDGVEEGETEAKPWNLRPRKVVTFPTTSSFKKGNRMLLDETVSCQKKDNSGGGHGHPKSSRLRGTMVEGTGHGSIYGSDRPRKVEEKKRLWISLSREEIEEDIYALTGSRPARKAKKRPKTVQKQLDVRIYMKFLFVSLVFFLDRLMGFGC